MGRSVNINHSGYLDIKGQMEEVSRSARMTLRMMCVSHQQQLRLFIKAMEKSAALSPFLSCALAKVTQVRGAGRILIDQW